jgi:hypothetical protein
LSILSPYTLSICSLQAFLHEEGTLQTSKILV